MQRHRQPTFWLFATGHTRIPLWTNIAGLAFYIPGLYILVQYGGLEGAALAWVLLNVYYVFVQLPLIQWRALRLKVAPFLFRNFLSFVLLGGGIFAIGRLFILIGGWGNTLLVWPVCALCMASYAGFGLLILDATIRDDMISSGKSILTHMFPVLHP